MPEELVGIVVSDMGREGKCAVYVEQYNLQAKLSICYIDCRMQSLKKSKNIQFGDLVRFPAPEGKAAIDRTISNSQCTRMGQPMPPKLVDGHFGFDGSFVCSPDGCIWWAELNVDLEPGEGFNVNLYRPNICYTGWMIPHIDRAKNTVKFTVNHLINISGIQQVVVSRTPWNKNDPAWAPQYSKSDKNGEFCFVFARHRAFLTSDCQVEFQEIPFFDQDPWIIGKYLCCVNITWLRDGYFCTKWENDDRKSVLNTRKNTDGEFEFEVPVKVVMTITEDKVEKLFSENLGDVAVTQKQLKLLRPKPFELVWVRKNDKWESDRNAPRWKLVLQTNFEPPITTAGMDIEIQNQAATENDNEVEDGDVSSTNEEELQLQFVLGDEDGSIGDNSAISGETIQPIGDNSTISGETIQPIGDNSAIFAETIQPIGDNSPISGETIQPIEENSAISGELHRIGQEATIATDVWHRNCGRCNYHLLLQRMWASSGLMNAMDRRIEEDASKELFRDICAYFNRY